MTVFNFFKLQHVFDLLTVQSAIDILLVAENHQSSTCQLFLDEEFGKFCSAVFESEFVPWVNDPNQAVSLLEVVAPVAANSGLASDIPNVQLEVVVLHCLYLEP